MRLSHPRVKAVLTAIGGYNSNQLLRHLDYDLIKANPRSLMRLLGYHRPGDCHPCQNRSGDLFGSPFLHLWNGEGIGIYPGILPEMFDESWTVYR